MTKELEMYRSDYPRPQFVREAWVNLNGEWEFEFDDQRRGTKEKWHKGHKEFSRKIQVPFAFQSRLSGIGDTAFHDCVWYRRILDVPAEWQNKRVLLHFGAVDYAAAVWVNGEQAVVHEGGHTPFYADITDALNPNGGNVLVVRAEDFSQDLTLPRGKQYWRRESRGIFYTRTTGIWQTVWMEAVAPTCLDKVQLTPDVDRGAIAIRAFVKGHTKKAEIALRVKITFEGKLISNDLYSLKEAEEVRTIVLQDYRNRGFQPFRRCHLWTPETPNLYDIHFMLFLDGQPVDEVSSYFGMRKISVDNGQLRLNERVLYMRLVLDQGYFPDGNLTPPSDEAIKKDVELTKAMGFNGVRKHQKIEDPRFLYWCDKLGLLVWGEAANGYQYSGEYVRRFTNEWQEAIDRDYNHPCLVAWVPLNEGWGVPDIKTDEFQQQHALAMYHLTKSLDQTRLVVSNDGWEHMRTDLLTIHDYEPSQEVLEERYSTEQKAVKAIRRHNKPMFVGGMEYEGQPIIVSEFGGISFKKSDWDGWGYSGAENEEQFLQKLSSVIQPMLTSPVVQGFCYTQLTDVEQEINGLLTYDRTPKVAVEQIRDIVAGDRVK